MGRHLVLSAKDFGDRLEQVIKSVTEGDDTADAMVRAIHDASVHLGAQCVGMGDDLSEDDEDGEAEGANKALALKLRLKALSRC